MHDADLYATLQYSIRNYVCSACSSRESKGATKKGGGSEPDFSPPPPQSKNINCP